MELNFAQDSGPPEAGLDTHILKKAKRTILRRGSEITCNTTFRILYWVHPA